MSREPNAPRYQVSDLQNPATADDALLHWDELDDQLLRMLAADPARGKRLARLQAADRWLRVGAADALRKVHPVIAAPTPSAPRPALLLTCPTPEDLYDFGQGPGAGPMSPEQREQIDRHLATCRECEQFAATLEVPPPVPFILGEEEDELADIHPRTATVPPPMRSPVRQRPRRLRIAVAAAAAAAAAVATFGVWHAFAPTPRLPDAPILRGDAGGPLLYPRDRVLAASADSKKAWPALGTRLVFEVEPQPEATEYRFDVARHEGGAFGKDEKLRSLKSSAPTSELDIELPVGHYTWSAWTVVLGLDQRLGGRDFEVRADPKLESELMTLATRSEPARTIAAVTLLDSHGYKSEARALAKTLPASNDRDRYLGHNPGR